MTRYRDLIRIRYTPAKGTSKRRRRSVSAIMERMVRDGQNEYKEALEQAALDLMLYGTSACSVTWDETGDGELRIEHVKHIDSSPEP